MHFTLWNGGFGSHVDQPFYRPTGYGNDRATKANWIPDGQIIESLVESLEWRRVAQLNYAPRDNSIAACAPNWEPPVGTRDEAERDE